MLSETKRRPSRWMVVQSTLFIAAISFFSFRRALLSLAYLPPFQSPLRSSNKKDGIPPILKTVESWKNQGQPFGRCGDGQNYTSLSHTADHFFAANYSFDFSSPGNVNTPFIQMTLTFQAVDVYGKIRTNGGDEFVMTLLCWTRSGDTTNKNFVVYKESTIAIDLDTGVYQVSFTVPRHEIVQFQLSLLHYYSCYQGLGPHKPGEAFFNIDIGPYNLSHPSLQHYLLNEQVISNKTAMDLGDRNPAWPHESSPLGYFDSPFQPYCEASQQGMDSFTAKGVWVEDSPSVTPGRDVTLDAQWKSITCQPRYIPKLEDLPLHRKEDGVLWIGDSTMPRKSVEIGDPFHHYIEFSRRFNHHTGWVDHLHERINSKEYPSSGIDNKRVLVFSGGLHQLYQRDRYSPQRVVRGYNVPTAVDLLLRMFCQLALVHPDRKLLLLGIGPVHQQHFALIDNTDHNVLWFNALLRKRVVDENGGRLADICAKVDLTNLWSIPDDDGNAQNRTRSRQIALDLGYQETQKETQLMDRLRASVIDDNRTVAFADIHDILLARPECYKDKIHDMKVFDYDGKPRSLLASSHEILIGILVRLRAEMNDP